MFDFHTKRRTISIRKHLYYAAIRPYRHKLGYMRLAVVLGVILALSGCATQKPAAPVGKLGYPEGRLLTVAGICPDRVMKGDYLLVQEVNGKSLREPVMIDVENVRALPKSVKIVAKGFEKGEWVGCEGCQWPHHYHSWFIITQVIAPASLKTEHSRFEKSKS